MPTSTPVPASQMRTIGLVPVSPEATRRPVGLTRRAVTCFPPWSRKKLWLFRAERKYWRRHSFHYYSEKSRKCVFSEVVAENSSVQYITSEYSTVQYRTGQDRLHLRRGCFNRSFCARAPRSGDKLHKPALCLLK